MVEAVLSVHGGTGPCRAVVVRRAFSPGGEVGGGGGSPRVGLAPPMVGTEGESTGVNVVQTTGPLGRDAGTGES